MLALRLKPIIEARAKAQQLRKPENSVSPNSDEQKSAVRTDKTVADLANVGKDTIRKIEQLENNAAPEIKKLAASGDVSINLAALEKKAKARQQGGQGGILLSPNLAEANPIDTREEIAVNSKVGSKLYFHSLCVNSI